MEILHGKQLVWMGAWSDANIPPEPRVGNSPAPDYPQESPGELRHEVTAEFLGWFFLSSYPREVGSILSLLIES